MKRLIKKLINFFQTLKMVILRDNIEMEKKKRAVEHLRQKKSE